ncbi:unnamed protein product [Phaedon cochleariae]|uniref:Phorbol-ester/DAG-type domain-containing protein n=1 Tax=Phaedon cochleariae TaxID=80249 RepID=A0A9N9SDC6_PHACE|nr:unnamed protein product [Phaedon cochleariae]
MPPPSTCGVCESAISGDNNDSLHCSVCFEQTHRTCGQLLSDSTWICTKCAENSDSSFKSTVAMNKDEPLTVKHFELIMNQLSSLNSSIISCNKHIKDLHSLVASHATAISNCESNISSIQCNNLKLNDRISQLENHVMEGNEEIYFECNERILREKNILMMGLPESRGNDDDLGLAKNILQSVAPVSEQNIREAIRFGKSTSGKQPLKIILLSSEIALDILRNKRKLSREQFPNISIRADLTPNQQKHLNALRSELEERKSHGEADITIKYSNNRPKIVKTTKTDSGNISLPSKRTRDEEYSPKRNSEQNHENCSQIVRNVISEKLEVDIKEFEIERCFRIGKSVGGQKNRPMIVVFSGIWKRNMIFYKKKLLKGTRLVIREDLTSDQQRILKATTEKIGRGGKVWTNFGTILVKYSDDEQPIVKVKCMEDVARL